jgi:hypothetical protein
MFVRREREEDAVAFARTVSKATLAFARQEERGEITAAHIDRLREPHSLLEVAKEVLRLDEDEEAYIAGIPGTVREGMRAGIIAAIDEGKRIHFQFKPAGDEHVVSLYEYDDAFVVHVEGPC